MQQLGYGLHCPLQALNDILLTAKVYAVDVGILDDCLTELQERQTSKRCSTKRSKAVL